jgi:hypothetical protein
MLGEEFYREELINKLKHNKTNKHNQQKSKTFNRGRSSKSVTNSSKKKKFSYKIGTSAATIKEKVLRFLNTYNVSQEKSNLPETRPRSFSQDDNLEND